MTGLAVAKPLDLDRLDQQILRCLQVDPRAAFSHIAAVIGASEHSVTQRYRRLHREGALRVIATVDPRALGESDWIVRVSTRPDATMDIARALSRRDDIAWVSIGSASDIVCAVRSHAARARDGLLGDRLPRTNSVLDVSAFVVLRRFVGGSVSDWIGLHGLLTPDQEAALGTAVRRPPPDSALRLRPTDYAMLDVLRRDGRAGYDALARASGLSEGRAERRLAALLACGALYFDVDVSGAALGHPVSALIWLTVPSADVSSVGEILAHHPQAPFVAAISGRSNVVISVICRNLDELYEYATDHVGAVAGVRGVEISPVLRRLKQAGAIVAGDRLSVASSVFVRPLDWTSSNPGGEWSRLRTSRQEKRAEDRIADLVKKAMQTK